MIDSLAPKGPPKIFCEVIGEYDPDNLELREGKARVDFYGDMGIVASCYDLFIAMTVKIALVELGYDVYDFPKNPKIKR